MILRDEMYMCRQACAHTHTYMNKLRLFEFFLRLRRVGTTVRVQTNTTKSKQNAPSLSNVKRPDKRLGNDIEHESSMVMRKQYIFHI